MYRRRYLLIFIRCTVTSLFGLMCLVCCLICCLVLRFFLPFDHRSTSCMYCPTYPPSSIHTFHTSHRPHLRSIPLVRRCATFIAVHKRFGKITAGRFVDVGGHGTYHRWNVFFDTARTNIQQGEYESSLVMQVKHPNIFGENSKLSKEPQQLPTGL